jgi:hypothetical protein
MSTMDCTSSSCASSGQVATCSRSISRLCFVMMASVARFARGQHQTHVSVTRLSRALQRSAATGSAKVSEVLLQRSSSHRARCHEGPGVGPKRPPSVYCDSDTIINGGNMGVNSSRRPTCCARVQDSPAGQGHKLWPDGQRNMYCDIRTAPANGYRFQPRLYYVFGDGSSGSKQ